MFGTLKITVSGAGYVGLSNGILMAQNHEVVAFDTHQKKLTYLMINSPIEDKEIENYLSTKILNFRATTNKYEAYKMPITLLLLHQRIMTQVQITLIHQALKLSFVT